MAEDDGLLVAARPCENPSSEIAHLVPSRGACRYVAAWGEDAS
jgi:hypothetical protein